MADMMDPDALDITTGKFSQTVVRKCCSGSCRCNVPTPAQVVAALFGDYGRRRQLKPPGTKPPKHYRPRRKARRGWQPASALT